MQEVTSKLAYARAHITRTY